ncbi:hypothetical protein BCR44DRAFT_41763 [Catenaria anguillulae PL171]|uniref:Uncharacterized protein n=1 Tax=Catenaria anguillulae PL171 TaxID=765915 RepID=A0A1Y2HIM1_9FUNG|nr:hypothetical protein BCR44DRAFT_41763 [Catenaria anguillulae PL171]
MAGGCWSLAVTWSAALELALPRLLDRPPLGPPCFAGDPPPPPHDGVPASAAAASATPGGNTPAGMLLTGMIGTSNVILVPLLTPGGALTTNDVVGGTGGMRILPGAGAAPVPPPGLGGTGCSHAAKSGAMVVSDSTGTIPTRCKK